MKTSTLRFLLLMLISGLSLSVKAEPYQPPMLGRPDAGHMTAGGTRGGLKIPSKSAESDKQKNDAQKNASPSPPTPNKPENNERSESALVHK